MTALVTDGSHSAECSVCHTGGVLGAGHVVHSTTPPTAAITAGNSTGCGNIAGCHATYDLHEIHKDSALGCTLAAATTP